MLLLAGEDIFFRQLDCEPRFHRSDAKRQLHYTLSKPWEISVALSKKSRVRRLPEYPPIKIHYFVPKIFNVGIEKIPIGVHEVRIYNREKTICDCMRYRKQIGQDIIKEMMVSYLKLFLGPVFEAICNEEELFMHWSSVNNQWS